MIHKKTIVLQYLFVIGIGTATTITVIIITINTLTTNLMTTTIMIIPNTIIPFRTGRVAFDAMGDRLFAEYKVDLGVDDDD